jgi:predicted metal-dependent peptidase
LEIAGITIPEVSTLTADKVYELLMQVAKQDSKNGNGDGGLGGVKGFDYHGYEQLSETEKENISDQITSWTIGAAAYAKLRGHMPAGIDEIINKYLAPKLNWLQILKREMVELVKGEYSFNRPNRKFRHIILPGQVKADGIKAVVSMDTSGSMTTENLTRTFNELRHLKSVYRELEIIIIQHDCIVQKIEKVTSRTKFDKLEARGRGGTAHLPVIEYIKKNLKGTKLYMAFTDGDSDIPESFPQLKCRKILFLNTSMYSVHKKEHFVKYARCYEVED